MTTSNFISLQAYFNKTNRYYLFFDGLIHQSGRMQREILADAKIPTSSYRVSRTVEESRTDSHLVLLKYFHINELDMSKQSEYEFTLSKIFSAIYYKSEEQIQMLYPKIVEYIEENNYLKPIFILFKIFIKMNDIKEYSQFLKEIKEDLEYVSTFPKEYFHHELETLYLLILLFTNKNKEALHIDVCSNNSPKLLWLYYHIVGTFAYFNENYAEAILFYKKAEEIYLRDCNIVRYIWNRNNIAAMYNRMGYEKLALETIQPIFTYSVNTSMQLPMKEYIVMHYFMSLFLLKAYEEILLVYDLYLKAERLLPTTSILLMCCYKILDYPKEKSSLLRNIDERTSLYYLVLYENKKLAKQEKSLLQSSNYLKRISKAMKLYI